MKIRTFLTVTAVMAAAAIYCHADQPEQRFIGYRNDATGVYPADCDPVTEWNMYDLKTVEKKDHRGRKKKVEVPAGESRKNIVWKTSIPMYCNGGMIVAGGKLFAQADRGGSGFARKLVPEFLGNQLICLDPADGSILWKRDLQHLELFPPEKAKEIEADLKEVNAFYVKAYSGFLAYRRVAGPVMGGGHGLPNYSKNMPDGFEEKFAKQAEAFSEVWKEVPRTPEALKEMAKQHGRFDRMWTWNYTQLSFENFMKQFFPKIKKKRDALGKYGYAWCAWYGQGSFVGAGMQTPVSDGESIYVHTGYNDVFCYDLKGNRKWVTWFGEMGDHHGTCLGSPVLVGDVLIVNGGGDHSVKTHKYIRGLDKKSGEILWEHTDFYTGKSYTRITPVPLTLPIGDTGKTVDVVWTGPGNVIRAKDGKILAEKIGCHGNGRHVGVSDKHDVIVLVNGSSDGGAGSPVTFPKGTVAVKLAAESEDKVTAKMLWNDSKGPSRLVVRDETVYGWDRSTLVARDLMTGKEIAKAKVGPRGWRGPNHMSVIAGDYLFGLDQYSGCGIVKIRGEGSMESKTFNLVEPEPLSKYDFWNQGAQLFASGNRIFIRSYTDVYCIGDPQQEMRLSKAHR